MSARTQINWTRPSFTTARLDDHALSAQDLEAIHPRIRNILGEIANERAAGQHRFRELPHERIQMAEILQAVADLRDSTDHSSCWGRRVGPGEHRPAISPEPAHLQPDGQ